MEIMMRKLLITLKLTLILSIISFSITVYADGNEAGIFERWIDTKNAGISSVKLQQYNDLCGSCHFPYQPGLLPGVSWEKIMNNLDSHFGQLVKMTDVKKRTMRRYLLDNSAGHVNDEISVQILQTLKYNPIPVRITQTPFIIDKHNQLENKIKPQSIGQCNRCHQDAQQGLYEKQNIHISDQESKELTYSYEYVRG